MSSNIRCPWSPDGTRCCIPGNFIDPVAECVYEAAKHGDQQTINDYIDNGFVNFNVILRGAAAGGQKELVDRVIAMGANDYINAARDAAFEGQRDMVYFFFDLNIADYVGVLKAAARGQQIALLRELLEWRSVPLHVMDSIGESLAENARALEDVLWTGIIDLNAVLNSAARGGNITLVQELLTRFDELSQSLTFDQTIDLDGAMASAAGGGHLELVRLLYESGATQVDWARARAMSNGQDDVADFLLQLGATEARPRDASINPVEYLGTVSMYSLKGLDTSSTREVEPSEN